MWQTGTVAITDDDSGSSLFPMGDLQPGDSRTACLNVSYVGTLPAAVTLFARAGTGSLGPHVRLTVVE